MWAASQPRAHGLAGAVSLAGCVDLTLTATLGLGDRAARRGVALRALLDRSDRDTGDDEPGPAFAAVKRRAPAGPSRAGRSCGPTADRTRRR